MALYEDQFDEQHDFSHQTDTRKTLIVASTVRSGSHMLGHILHQTGGFGFPLEYGNKQNLKQWKQRLGHTSTSQCMKALMQRRTSPNGVFGIKVHYSHLPEFGGFANLCKLFPNPHFILLTREDLMAQAVSLSIARQTGSWIAKHQDSTVEPQYNFNDIDEGLRRIIFENSSWRYTLAASGAKYMELNFSEVKTNTANTVLRIADFIEQDIDATRIPITPVTQKQSNELNQQWLSRFTHQFDPTNELMRYNQQSIWRKLMKKLGK